MSKFTNFISDVENLDFSLNEALNSAVEFYITDDTKLPNEIYAAYQHNGADYGMSLTRSQWNGVYLIHFYRIVNDKKRHWAFKGSKDIPVGLSTLIKFVEASQPFLGEKMKGVIAPLPAAKDSQRYLSFMRRVMKKTHIKSYREVPVKKLSDKARNYLFLIKKTTTPEKLFKSPVFSKHFSFDSTDQITIDTEGMEIATEPLKKEKLTASIVPDPVLAFGKLSVELTAGEELFGALSAATDQYNVALANPESPEAATPKVNLKPIDIAMNGVKINDDGPMIKIPITVAFALMLPTAYKVINQSGFDPSKVDKGNMEYVISQYRNKIPSEIWQPLVDTGIITQDGKVADMAAATTALSDMTKISEETVKAAQKLATNYKKNGADAQSSSTANKSPDGSLELDFDINSSVDGFETSNASEALDGPLGFAEYKENMSKKKASMYNMPSVKAWRQSLDEGVPPGYKHLVKYTGSFAATWNNELRSVFKGQNVRFDGITSQSRTLMKYFVSSAPALDAGIWVYRNASFPDDYAVGEDIIDAAYVSTTIRSDMTLGSGGNARLKIFLPKGTKCFPILDESNHSQENEIVLPPLTALKVIEKKSGNGSKVFYTCVMIGSAVESFIQTDGEVIYLNETKEEDKNMFNESNNKEKKQEYDRDNKWGEPISDKADSKKIKDLIKKGKLKLK